MTTPSQEETIKALVELVREGSMNWVAAVKAYRLEFRVNYREAADHGLVAQVQLADNEWRENLNTIKIPARIVT